MLIFLLTLIFRFLIFLISTLSATAAIGLFFGYKFLISIVRLFEIILPFHLLGLKGLIGVIASFPELRDNIGPCTDKL